VERVLGVGISIPGTVNEETAFVKIAPNIGVSNVDFRPYEDLFQLPVFLENDAMRPQLPNWFWDWKEMRNLVFLCVLRWESAQASSWTDICIRAKINVPENRHTTIASHGKSVRADAAIVGTVCLGQYITYTLSGKNRQSLGRSKNSLPC
jgi:hypothetical protein